MQLPLALQEAIISLTESFSTKSLREAREKISADYRQNKSSTKGFQNDAQLLSYLVTRMPATYAANAEVLRAVRERYPSFKCHSLLDLGAGPGAASWAALEIFPELLHLHLIERESSAIEIGKKLMLNQAISEKAKWQCASIDKCELINADLAVLSYVLAELPKEKSIALIDRLFEANISVVAIVEPGTPKGFERIRFFREYALQRGVQIIAPCPHHFACPMPSADWCHFSARVQRTRLHRQLKKGSLGYEDEKYSYVAYANSKFPLYRSRSGLVNLDSLRQSKIDSEASDRRGRGPSGQGEEEDRFDEVKPSPNSPNLTASGITPIEGRIIRPPRKESGFVRLPLCAQDGTLKEITISRSNKEKYRMARDAEWGNIIY